MNRISEFCEEIMMMIMRWHVHQSIVAEWEDLVRGVWNTEFRVPVGIGQLTQRMATEWAMVRTRAVRMGWMVRRVRRGWVATGEKAVEHAWRGASRLMLTRWYLRMWQEWHEANRGSEGTWGTESLETAEMHGGDTVQMWWWWDQVLNGYWRWVRGSEVQGWDGMGWDIQENMGWDIKELLMEPGGDVWYCDSDNGTWHISWVWDRAHLVRKAEGGGWSVVIGMSPEARRRVSGWGVSTSRGGRWGAQQEESGESKVWGESRSRVGGWGAQQVESREGEVREQELAAEVEVSGEGLQLREGEVHGCEEEVEERARGERKEGDAEVPNDEEEEEERGSLREEQQEVRQKRRVKLRIVEVSEE